MDRYYSEQKAEYHKRKSKNYRDTEKTRHSDSHDSHSGGHSISRHSKHHDDDDHRYRERRIPTRKQRHHHDRDHSDRKYSDHHRDSERSSTRRYTDDSKSETWKHSSDYKYNYGHSNDEQECSSKDPYVKRSTSKCRNTAPSESEQSDEEGPDYEFDWEGHRRTLSHMFFASKDFIKRGTAAYDDFWAFLAKYQAFQRKSAIQNRKTSAATTLDMMEGKQESVLGLPTKYNKRFKVNLALPNKLAHALYEQHCRDDEDLTVNRIEQFKAILLYYLDFAQKQKFAKLQKIKRDQGNLPIFKHKQEIIDTIRTNQVVVVAGDTGCGKSTQVPQYLLEAGFTKIACTQPRRIACISLAKRVSFETLNEYGSDVAHQVRFEKTRTKSTRILFLTEGLLLRQIMSDMLLSQYSVIVIDEVHERHIHTDFLLGVMKCILLQRDDLKLVLMSATINIDLFSGFFNHCPVIKVPGRLYPIVLEYKALTIDEQGSKSERLDPAPYIRILQLINHKYLDSERGDVLMFLSGLSEIMSVVEAARAYAQKTKKWIILPLHSSLSIAEQDKVFDIAPDGIRKCIVSTNIAETSVTIDGVRFVVDSGKVKEMSFDSKYKMQRLQEFWISGASAEQRKGRAGRTGPGVCFRLYTDADYEAFQEYSTPEIQRVPLDSLILQMISMGLPDSRKFPYLEPPSDGTIETSVRFLKDQGAITDKEDLTPIGQMLSQLPVDIIIGKMLIMASIFQLVDPVLSIAASLSVQTPFTSKSQRDSETLSRHKELQSDHGDPITLLNAFDEWLQIKAERGDTRKWCQRRGLEQQRFYEMSKLKRQFQDLLQEYGMVSEPGTEDSESMTREERRQRNINRKRLRDLKQEQRRTGKKRKVLKLEDEDWEVEEDGVQNKEEPDLDNDIRDLEFKLSNNLDRLQEKQNRSRRLTLKDITLLKVILCSGLFPHVAIADEHNSFKADSDQVFHTKQKGFVVLHPTSVFTTNPEVLELREHEVKEVNTKGPAPKGQLSNKHQLLTFVTLLETQKPYLTGCLRVPALQTLLLFSSTVDTNADCSRMLFNEWLEVRFELAEQAEHMLTAAVKLRQTWLQLLELKLQVSGVDRTSMEPDVVLLQKISRMQELLGKKLAEFLYCDVYYYTRRVLSAELKVIYIGPGLEVDSGSTVQQSALKDILHFGGEPHPHKGGVHVNQYLVYNCLVEDDPASGWGEYSTSLQRHWTCTQCGESLVVTLPEKLQHEQQCHQENVSEIDQSTASMDTSKARKEYHCMVCDQTLHLTTAEIFKHKKSCR